ncbi:MAG TPA: DNA-formamidopyrimidine glycosylase family protein, partial [Candidatus Saccharimonadia bacterium]|nr:DNA-formamidopyrimidine glycosylase family protein [Candidatus Saccharimonadia bacterium]
NDVAKFARRRVLAVEGNTRLDAQRLVGKTVRAFRSHGKHFLVELPGFALRVHFLLWGTYRIDERKPDKPIRLGLRFTNGELNLYSCSLRILEGALDEHYDWRSDVLADAWSPALARRKLKAMPDTHACDALLDQNVFAGVGNIIKNEVLVRIRVHPLSTIGALPPRKLGELIREARKYSFDFLRWKRAYVLRKHWLAHRKRTCPRCEVPLALAHLGRTARRAFYCESCQVRYGESESRATAAPRNASKPARRGAAPIARPRKVAAPARPRDRAKPASSRKRASA